MTVIKRQQVDGLLAQWPADVRLLLLAGPDESGVATLAARALATLADAGDPLSIIDLPPERLKADPGLLADEAASLSMFGGRRVVRVDGAGEATVPALELLLAVPAAGNPVVMTAGDIRKTSALWKLTDKAPTARLAICYMLEGQDMQRWLTERARAEGLTLAPGIGERLAAAAGNDIGVLARELEKFALYLNATPDNPQRLEAAHVEALGVDSLDEDLLQLVSALIAGNDAALDRQLGLLPPNNAIGVLRVLARRLLQLAEIRTAMDRGASAGEAITSLRPPMFWKERDSTAAAMPRWSQRRIHRALDRVLEAEAAIKTPSSAGDVLGLQAVAGMAAAMSGLGGRRRSA